MAVAPEQSTTFQGFEPEAIQFLVPKELKDQNGAKKKKGGKEK